jgi:deazaflavin-dependent oxidoreductase (nitroreductase family)
MPVNPLWIKITSATHLFWYRLTGGLIGGSIFGAPILLLTTTGRKSGARRTTPLLYLEEDGRYIVIASNGGNPNHPAWYLNLRAHPEAEAQVRSRTLPVRARVADEAERARLWPKVVEMYSGYADYQRSTTRRIPVVILDPAGS